jgi:hypothetical protein
MVIAMNPGATWEWVAPEDRALPEAQQTVWTLRSLDVRQQATINDASYSVQDDAVRFGSMQRLTLAYGLVDVRNFRDAAGLEVKLEFTRGAHGQIVSDGSLSKVPASVRSAMAEAITQGNRLDATDRKN